MPDRHDLQDELAQGLADARNCTTQRTARRSDPRVAGDVATSMRGVWLRGEPREEPDESIRDADRVSNLTLPSRSEVRRERR